jgi:hypothetical protein
MIGSFPTSAASAVDVLRRQHRRLNQLFVDYFAARSESRRYDLVPLICNAVNLHLRLEADTFFPALTRASGDQLVAAAAAKEQEWMLSLTDELSHPDPGGYDFSEQVYGFWNVVRTHIATAERPNGLFERCARLNVDDAALACVLRRRNYELREEWQQRSPVVSVSRLP